MRARRWVGAGLVAAGVRLIDLAARIDPIPEPHGLDVAPLEECATCGGVRLRERLIDRLRTAAGDDPPAWMGRD